MNLQKVSFANTSSQLSHALNEWRTLNITHCASQLNDTHIGRFVRVIHGDLSNSLDPILNGVRQVRDHLHRLPQIVTTTFALDDVLVDLPGGDVVLAGEGNIEVAFVVA
jgi:GTP1/Obg family GTP-binding protein